MSSFRWLDILEKEFDKSFLELDVKLKDYEEYFEEYVGSKCLSEISSAFVQALHKAQTVFQVNAKLEAQLLHLREELATSKAQNERLQLDKEYLFNELSRVLEGKEIHLPPSYSNSPKGKFVTDDSHRLALLRSENNILRRRLLELESEVVGSRLDVKYLDKELAGRIQQIQILLASNTSQDHKHRVWSQIETEMHLQKSKTISNICYSKQKVRNKFRELSKEVEDSGELTDNRNSKGCVGRAKFKQVHLLKNDADELGLAILGGKEHDLPIMVSETFPETAVGRSKKICAGDVILAVNGDSFKDFGHLEAVKYLSALRGTIRFDLECRVDEEIESICDTNNRFYDIYLEENSPQKIAPREEPTNSQTSRASSIISYPGKATDMRKMIDHKESSPVAQEDTDVPSLPDTSKEDSH
ncbi:Golgi-associated PDZ and coiled-coil motif-containing protein [Lepeophtheirus salmonis]|uniref:Golgi-associated PDZ and coiled-coil motif-containing protein n=1 Tax=Lepeophtheirus salmonis TaxID=72036 RepID=UPI001AE73EFC|nr:Golgi-associated PDZ and coiled-coil motif-containing protein-like [Lepeophtheirus salmonis]